MSKTRVFVPHNECWMASGACFEEGRCLGHCQPQLPVRLANSELATAMRLLKELAGFVRLTRGCTQYVDGSTVDLAAKEAFELLSRNQ